MQAQQSHIDVLSNNLANLNTTGFKRQLPTFVDLAYRDIVSPGAESSNAGTLLPTGKEIGLGVKLASVYEIMEQGDVSETKSPFDIAIQGNGFFRVQMPDGSTGHTRDGSFQVNETGQLVTKDGYPVDPNITVPIDAESFTITDAGIVTANVNDVNVNLGQLTLDTFVNPAGLNNIGANYYKETVASGAPTTSNPTENGAGGLLQGFLEGSNVNPVSAVTSLITAQRSYEMNSKVISTTDEMLAALSQI
jgi:flagellar basal-body rod protein FlgG